MVRTLVTIILTIVALLLALILVNLFRPSVVREQGIAVVAFSEFLDDANTGAVRSVVIDGSRLRAETSDGRTLYTYIPNDPALPRELAEKHIQTIIEPPWDDANPGARLVLAWTPTVIFSLVWFFVLNRIVKALRALNATLAANAPNRGLD